MFQFLWIGVMFGLAGALIAGVAISWWNLRRVLYSLELL
jgi:cell division protein FtsX